MNNRKINKAVFPVAGLGSRFLPATKAMPKELLPIINKPLIQFATEEAVRAGIDTLIFVTGRNKRAIEDHFDTNIELEAVLREMGKGTEADMVNNILNKDVQCVFVRQPKQLGLGHAVLCAEKVINNEPFAVILADDFLVTEQTGVVSELANAFNRSGHSQLSVLQVDGPEISNYGVVRKGSQKRKIEGIIEKPKKEDAPSNLASIGRYVLSPTILDILKTQKAGLGGEIQLADAINRLAQVETVEAIEFKGSRFDCGSVKGYLEAIMHVSGYEKK